MIPQRSLLFRLLRHPGQRPVRRGAESHYARHILRPCPESSLLASSVHKRPQFNPRADIKHPHPLGPVQLVGAGAEQINLHLLRINGNLPESLYRVRME